MTDNEIIKALECCMKNDCDNCFNSQVKPQFQKCNEIICKEALDLINRQKDEIERLKHRKTELQIRNQELQHEKSEAIKEFCEKRGIKYVEDDI